VALVRLYADRAHVCLYLHALRLVSGCINERAAVSFFSLRAAELGEPSRG
jgi:hypothetical protein